jgi:hypothetical protein
MFFHGNDENLKKEEAYLYVQISGLYPFLMPIFIYST